MTVLFQKDLGWATAPGGDAVWCVWVATREWDQLLPGGIKLINQETTKIPASVINRALRRPEDDVFASEIPRRLDNYYGVRAVFFLQWKEEDVAQVAYENGYLVEPQNEAGYPGRSNRSGYWGEVWPALADLSDPLVRHRKMYELLDNIDRLKAEMEAHGEDPTESNARMHRVCTGMLPRSDHPHFNKEINDRLLFKP